MMILIIKGKIIDNKYVKGDVLFNNLTPLINNILIVVKSDLYYNVCLKQLNRQVHNELSSHIIPLT
jgi:hypothetical protein